MNLIGRHFAVDINVATRSELMGEVSARFAQGRGFALATLNLDHVSKLEREESFRSAYYTQDLIVADGNPIVWLSRIAKAPVELIPGSELVVPLAQLAANMGASVALIGSSDASLEAAGQALRTAAPGLHIAYVHAPAYGFDPTGDDARNILKTLNESGARLAFLALGAPKQELFAALGRTLAPQTGFASIGAGLDFLAGTQVRAPKWMRKLALEWLWRLGNNPRRLFGRYVQCVLVLPGLALRAYCNR